MRAPEPQSSAVIPVPHCPDVTVPGVGYWPLKCVVRPRAEKQLHGVAPSLSFRIRALYSRRLRRGRVQYRGRSGSLAILAAMRHQTLSTSAIV